MISIAVASMQVVFVFPRSVKSIPVAFLNRTERKSLVISMAINCNWGSDYLNIQNPLNQRIIDPR